MRTLKSLKQLTLHEFRSMMRNKIAFFFNLIMPVVLVAIFGSMYGGMDKDYNSPTGWINRDGGPVAAQLEQILHETKRFELVTGDEADLRRDLSDGRLRAILVLPEDLSEKVAAGQVPQVAILRDPSSNSSNQDAAMLYSVIGRVGAEMSGAAPKLVPVMEDMPGMDRFGLYDFLMPGQLVYMLLAAGLMTVAINLAHQRQSGSMRHLFTTPLPIGVWFGAQMLANVALASLQIVVLFAAGRLMFGVHAPYNVPATLVVLFISSLTCLSMGLAVGALVKSPEAAFPVSMILFFVIAMFGNAMMPLDGAPAFMMVMQKVTPSYFMTEALRQIMMQGKGIGAIVAELGALLGFMIVCGSLAFWRIRKQMTVA